MNVIDLRSDTVTKPSPAMWNMLRSLDNSKIGDDVLGEDPTINELEEKAAKIIGKEAALYVTSGTQGNLVSLLSHTHPGDQILVEELSHLYMNEVESATRIGGLMIRTYPSNKGVPSFEHLQEITQNNEDTNEHPITLFCTENTHNYYGGTVIKPSHLANMKKFTERNNLKLHLDGARIFNAAVALGLPVTEFTKHVDSIMFCLSKGLSCPVGSIVAGSKQFILKARKFRKMVGGGMRQAGIIASFGLVALEQEWIQRLKEDHYHAKLLAEGLRQFDFPISIPEPETNILIITFPEKVRVSKFIGGIRKEGVLAFNIDKHRVRFVTHYGITKEDIHLAIKKIGIILKAMFK